MGRFGLTLAIALGLIASTVESAEHVAFPIKQGGKWGFMDKDGAVVVSPKYKHAGKVVNGRALVLDEARWCYFDVGQERILESPLEGDHSNFRNGRASGSIGLAFRFIDEEGNLIPGEFASVEPFSEGFAPVLLNESRFDKERDPLFSNPYTGKWGFADLNGHLVIPALYDELGTFSHGLAPALRDRGDAFKDNQWGYINAVGNWEIRPRFASASPFSEGVAAVELHDGTSTFIDTHGRFVFKPRQVRSLYGLHDGRAVCLGGSDRRAKDYGYVDRDGKVVITEAFSHACDFSEGLAAVRDRSKKWGYIDRDGEWIVEPKFDACESFHQGLGMVTAGKRIGYVNKRGQFVWPLME